MRIVILFHVHNLLGNQTSATVSSFTSSATSGILTSRACLTTAINVAIDIMNPTALAVTYALHLFVTRT